MTTPQDQAKPPSESQRHADLVSNWYQSYYLWTTAVMTNHVANSRMTNHAARVMNIPLGTSPSSSQPQVLRRSATFITPSPPALSIYKVPSLGRRFAAECLDAFYIQCVKIALVLFFINYTDLISEDSFSLYDFLEDVLTEDTLNNVRLPFELIVLEIIYVLISVVFESYCLYRKGYTPGKYIFNMRVVSCKEINELATPGHIQIQPGVQLGIKAILMRTCLKNFSIIFLFPTILFFLLPAFVENGQTTYDKISESIVVENI